MALFPLAVLTVVLCVTLGWATVGYLFPPSKSQD